MAIPALLYTMKRHNDSGTGGGKKKQAEANAAAAASAAKGGPISEADNYPPKILMLRL